VAPSSSRGRFDARDLEPRPAAIAVDHADLPPVCVRDLPDDAQPVAGSSLRGGVPRLEHPAAVLTRHVGSVVGHVEPTLARPDRHGQVAALGPPVGGHRRPFASVFDRVPEQVLEHLVQPTRVRTHCQVRLHPQSRPVGHDVPPAGVGRLGDIHRLGFAGALPLGREGH
jgi:hypothetical protein